MRGGERQTGNGWRWLSWFPAVKSLSILYWEGKKESQIESSELLQGCSSLAPQLNFRLQTLRSSSPVCRECVVPQQPSSSRITTKQIIVWKTKEYTPITVESGVCWAGRRKVQSNYDRHRVFSAQNYSTHPNSCYTILFRLSGGVGKWKWKVFAQNILCVVCAIAFCDSWWCW